MRSLKQLRAFVASLALVLSWDLALVPRRVALRGVGCGCWGCLSNAWAEVEVKQELPLSHGRQDADFAKGMAFGILDFSLTRRFWFPACGWHLLCSLFLNLVSGRLFVACCW